VKTRPTDVTAPTKSESDLRIGCLVLNFNRTIKKIGIKIGWAKTASFLFAAHSKGI
jgi:hypothetical protein